MSTHFPPQQDADPFADDSGYPAVSWANASPGTIVTGTIASLPKEIQDRAIGTREPKVWKDGSPKMVIVFTVDVQIPQGTERRSVWAKKPSSMYRAIVQAQKDAKERLTIGGTLHLKLEKLEPSKTPGFSPQKIYAAKYIPPVVTATTDPFMATATPAQAPLGTQPAPQQQWPVVAQPATSTRSPF